MAFLPAKAAQSVHKAMTGRKPAGTITNLSAAVRETYGSNKRGNPNAKAAAADLGVSERTVRRWLTGTQKPSGPNTGKDAAAIERAEQQRQTRMRDPQYRTQAMPPSRAARFAKNGMQISLGGNVQISNDRRNRDFGAFRVNGKAAEKINQAWLSGDDAALKDALEAALSDYHIGSDAEIHQLSSLTIRH